MREAALERRKLEALARDRRDDLAAIIAANATDSTRHRGSPA